MTVYTRRLGVISGTAPNVWSEVCRAQTGFVTVLRDIVVTNPTPAAVEEFAIRVRPVTKAGEWWIAYKKPLDIGTMHLEMRQELVAGEALEVFSTTTGLYVAVTGYLLRAD